MSVADGRGDRAFEHGCRSESRVFGTVGAAAAAQAGATPTQLYPGVLTVLSAMQAGT